MKPKLNAAFWKWFGDSVVRNEDGSPMVVYHGTTDEFDAFDTDGSHIGSHFSSSLGPASYYSGRKRRGGRLIAAYLRIEHPWVCMDLGRWGEDSVAKEWVRQQGQDSKDIEVWHPVLMEIRSFGPRHSRAHENRTIKAWLASKGYDGIYYLNRYESGSGDKSASAWSDRVMSHALSDEEFQLEFPESSWDWIAFYPWQIKSVGNDGTWDADDPNIGSNPEEPSGEILGYHCTSEKNVDLILKNGFESIPYMVDDGSFFDEHFYSCLRMLSVPEEKKGELEELHDRKRKKATEEMSRLWHDEYGHGAVIWISHSSPATEFGEACLSVSRLPKGSVEIASDGVYGSAYWCPVSPIPAQNFKRHPNVGSNPPASEGQVDIKGLVSARITVDPDYPAINPPKGRPEDARAKMAVALDTELKSTFGGNQIYWFGPFVIIGDGLGGILGKIEASFWPAYDWVIDGVKHSHGPRLHLAFIGVEEEQRGKGNATAILSALAQIADKYGWEMDGNVDPQPDEKGQKPPMNRRQLMKFYRKFGFEPQSGIRDGIIRRPSGANPEDGIGEA